MERGKRSENGEFSYSKRRAIKMDREYFLKKMKEYRSKDDGPLYYVNLNIRRKLEVPA